MPVEEKYRPIRRIPGDPQTLDLEAFSDWLPLSRVLRIIDDAYCKHRGGETTPGMFEANALWRDLCDEWRKARKYGVRHDFRGSGRKSPD